MTRRAALLGSLAVASTAALAACSSETAPADAGGGTGRATDSFPVKVRHKLGTTTVTSEPKRVVSVGLTEQDFLLALGIVPVGDTDWYGDQPRAIWPWAKKALGDATPPTMLTNADGIQYLEVAKLRPDLIVGPNGGLDEKSYGRLSKIAPTIGAPLSAESEYFDSWRAYLKLMGAAVGRSAAAAKLERSIDAGFADAAAAHPEFAGKTALFIQGGVSDGNFYAYPKGLGTEFLTDLGFDIPTEVDRFVPADGGQALVPAERIDVFDAADYLVWATETTEDEEALKALPGFSDLAAVKAGRSIYTGAVLSGAIYFSSPLSLPYVVEKLVPLLEG